eukprot:COSAG02_NODE_589_length_19902_cov_119.928939_4_plen_1346_part_00
MFSQAGIVCLGAVVCAVTAQQDGGVLTTVPELDAMGLSSSAPSSADVAAALKGWEQRSATSQPGNWDTELRAGRQSAANLKRLRRRTQNGPGSEWVDMWTYDSSTLLTNSTAPAVEWDQIEQADDLQPSSRQTLCDDPLSSNNGATGPCDYDCATLQQYYFPDRPSRCFMYDRITASWPSELMSMRQDRLDWTTFLPRTHPVGATLSFGVGSGDTDTCTDTIIRMSMSEIDPAAEWTLTSASSDVSTSGGPWDFSTPAGPGVYEHVACMSDSNYTLTRQSGDEWHGSIEVVSFVPDKTIVIPLDEQWIVHGGLVDDLPVKLDARFKSGYGVETENGWEWVLSTASLVLRHVRFSNQQATLDKDAGHRSHSEVASGSRLGGVLEYIGGWGASLIFEHCVFDHIFATSGAAAYIHGETAMWSRNETLRRDPQALTTTIIVHDCLFWELQGMWAGGIMRLIDIYPMNLTITDSQLIECWAYIGQIAWTLYGSVFDEGTGIDGTTHISLSRVELAGVDQFRWYGEDGRFDLCPLAFPIALPGHRPVGPGTERPDVWTYINVDQLYSHDNIGTIYPGFIAEGKSPCAGACYALTVTNSELNDHEAVAQTMKMTAALMTTVDIVEVRGSRFARNRIRSSGEVAIAEGGSLGLVVYVSAKLVNLSVVDSSAALGGGAVLQGPADFEIIGCLFQGNIAWDSGGAIRKFGSGSLIILDSIFNANQARREVQVLRDIVVHVYTGSLGRTGYFTPIWKLDGVQPDQIDGSCGNDTIHGLNEYDVQSTYAHVVSTSTGPHTLWHGLHIDAGAQARDWEGGGWIDIMGILSKMTPTVCDSRMLQCSDPWSDQVRTPGCYTQLDTSSLPEGVVPCPNGHKVWSKTDFVVPQGVGGAITATDGSTLEIIGATFSDNSAGSASAISVASFESFKVSHSDFAAPTSNTVLAEGTPAYDCSSFPCSVGERCRISQLSLFCDPCSVNEYGDGKTCYRCLSGTEPNSLKDGCDACSPGKYSELGFCDDCGAGTVAPGSGQVLCDACPLQTAPNADSTQCLCSTGSYNATASVQICYSRGFDATQLQDSFVRDESTPTGIDCDSCPTDQTGEPCLLCEDGLSTVRPGFISPLPLDQDSMTLSIFRCHNDMSTGIKRCPGSSTGTARRLQEGPQCNTGYTGIICGECSDGYGMSNSECVPCEDTGYTWGGLAALIATLVGILLLLFLAGKKWKNFPLKHVIRCAAQPLRILITYSQVTSQLGDILDFQFPGLFGDVIEILRPLIDLWGLLFRALGPSECFGLGGFNSRWFLRVLGLPGIMSLVVFIICCVHMRIRDRTEAISAARSNLAFVVPTPYNIRLNTGSMFA